MPSAIVWSKDNCPMCDKAKNMLNEKGIPYEVRTIDGVTWTKEMLLEEVPLAKSVPQIFIDHEYVGGFTELKTKLKG